MPRKNRPFQDLLLERLANPEVATYYLNEALEESHESFLIALKTVAQARQMSKVAKDSGVQRETLYRSLSEQGNPTLDTLSSVLKAVGLKIIVGLDEIAEPAKPLSSVPVPAIIDSTINTEWTSNDTIFLTYSSTGIDTHGAYVNSGARFLGGKVATATPRQNIDPLIDIPPGHGLYYNHADLSQQESDRLVGLAWQK